MSTTQFAPWQKVTVTNKNGTKELIVYQSTHKEIPTRNTYYVTDYSEHYIITTTADHEGTENKVTWCIECQGGVAYNDEGIDCIHTKAVIEFLKKKGELESQKFEYEEYTGNWESRFYVTDKVGKCELLK
jgi:hypothetical protein